MKVKAKRKGKKTVSVSATVENIDYDLLTVAIIRAIEESDNSKQKNAKVLTSAMAMFLSVLFAVISVAMGLLTAGAIVAYFNITTTKIWTDLATNTKGSISIVIWSIIIVMIVTALIMALSAIEIWKEKDRNFIISAFSGVVGFAALVVAIISLLVGVS